MPEGYRDFRQIVSQDPSLQGLAREAQAKATYLRDKHTLPDGLKRLFDGVTVLRLPVEEVGDIVRAMDVATGEAASVSLGLRGDTLHYVRKSLALLRDREVTMGRYPRSDAFEGEVLPQLDGFEMDLTRFQDVDVDGAHGVARIGVAAKWSDAFNLCRTKGWILPLLPTLPLDPYVGDLLQGTSALSAYRGDPAHCLRNVDFVGADSNYGECAFDHVPNSAAGYDLNGLFAMMGDSLGIPITVTLSLLPSPEDLLARRYGLSGGEPLVQALTKLAHSGLTPLRLLFGDEVGAATAFEADGLGIEILLHGPEDTQAPQVALADAAVGVKSSEGGRTTLPRKPQPVSPLTELRLSLADLAPLWEDLGAWAAETGGESGIVGSLHESGSVTLTPFVTRPISRGDRFDRLLELLQVAERHPCALRSNHLVQLLTTAPDLESRFALARRIKERVDLPMAINPSGVLWIPSS